MPGLRRLPTSRPRRSAAPLLGRYRVLEELGRGGSGTVHRALDLRHRREVALKVLAPGADRPALLRFVGEQSVRVRHPHVLAPTAWAAEDDLVVIVMDLARGGSLLDRVGPTVAWAEADVRRLLDQLLQALEAVHDAGLVHGDVSPANLLLDQPAPAPLHVRLADFGLAAPLGSPLPGRCPGGLGTPGYLAPERGPGVAAHPGQDVWAAGVLGRRLLARPGPLSTLLASMTRTDPERRPSPTALLGRLRSLPPTARRPDVGTAS